MFADASAAFYELLSVIPPHLALGGEGPELIMNNSCAQLGATGFSIRACGDCGCPRAWGRGRGPDEVQSHLVQGRWASQWLWGKHWSDGQNLMEDAHVSSEECLPCGPVLSTKHDLADLALFGKGCGHDSSVCFFRQLYTGVDGSPGVDRTSSSPGSTPSLATS